MWITDGRAKPLMDREQQSEKSHQSEKSQRTEAASIYFSTPETWTVECNCRRIFANIWFSQVWKHSSYTYAIPWCFKIWAWLRHEFLETAIPWWFTSKFWPRHELGMSLSFDCIVVCYTGFGLNVASCKSSARHWWFCESLFAHAGVCVCVSILCPLFLRVSLPSIYSFLSLFVCYWLIGCLFFSDRSVPVKDKAQLSILVYTLNVGIGKFQKSDVRSRLRPGGGSLEHWCFSRLCVGFWITWTWAIWLICLSCHVAHARLCSTRGLGALITFLTSLREGPRNLLPLLTCCTCSLMLNTGAGGGLITFLTPLRQGPRNLELTGSTDVPTRPVPQVSNPKGGRVVDELCFLCSCPHAPMSPCPRPPCPLSVKPKRCGWWNVVVVLAPHIPMPPCPYAHVPCPNPHPPVP